MCDSLKETDPKFENAMKLVRDDACEDQNVNLSKCLNENNRNWVKCKVIILLFYLNIFLP